jgi:hypothetical protein
MRKHTLLVSTTAFFGAIMLMNAQAADVKSTIQATATVTYPCTISVQGEVFIPCKNPSYPEKVLIMEGSKAVLKREGNYYVIT